MDDMREIIRSYITVHFIPASDPASLNDDADLKEEGVLDSLSTLKLLAFLEERFQIEFVPDDLGAGNLSTVTRIEKLVKEKIGSRP